MKLSEMTTKQLKTRLNDVLAELSYDSGFDDLANVAPLIGALILRGFNNISLADTSPSQGLFLYSDTLTYPEIKTLPLVVYQTGFSKDPLDYRPLNDEFKFSIKVPTDGEIVLRYSDGKVSKSGNYVALMGKSLPLFHFLAEPNRTFSFGVFDNLYAYAKMYGKTLRVLDDDEVSRVFKVSKDAAAQMLVFGVKDLDPSTSIQFPTEDAYSAVLTFPENNGLFSPYLKGPYTKLSKGDPKAFGLMKDAFGPLYEAKGENFRVVRQDGLPGVSEDAFKKQYDSPPQDPKDTPKAVEPEKSNKLLWILGGITLTAAVAYAIHRSKTEEI